jgi:crossover junction endodeoxyribonuclease RusA
MAVTMALRTVSFDVIGIAQPKGSTRAFLPKGAAFPVTTSANPRLKQWEHLVAVQAQAAGADGLFLGPVLLEVTFYLPRPQSAPRRVVHHLTAPDLDKLVRGTMDALTGILYRDDSQVVQISAWKVFAVRDHAPHAVITVAEAVPLAVAVPIQPLFDCEPE